MKLKKVLYTLLITGVIVSSDSAFAYENTDFTNSTVPIVSIEFEDRFEEYAISRSMLFEEIDFNSPDGVSDSFATPSGNSSNMNVYFKGSPSDAVVTLQKKGLFGRWKKVDSFTPSSSNNYFKEMSGKAGTTYRVKIDSNSGADISGHIRVNQL